MTAIAFVCALLLTACSDPVEHHIDTLVKGGLDAGQAKLRRQRLGFVHHRADLRII